MPKRAKELSALEISRLTTTGSYPVGVVTGLYLQVTKTGSRSWLLRYMIAGKRRERGLGPYPDVTFAMALEKARSERELIAQAIDPIDAAKAIRSANLAERARAVTFREAAAAYIKAKEPEWSNAKHAGQWRATLETYADPFIGDLLVKDIEQGHIMQLLEPIWSSKNETATRVRGRIEKVLDWARVKGYRQGENPARWRGHLEALLPKPGKVQKIDHHAALPFVQLHDFMTELRQQGGEGARALQFAILTACRSGEVRGATWDEIDLAAKVWTIPAQRMKAKQEHRVPLNDDALALLASVPTDRAYLFGDGSRAISDMTLTAALRRMNESRSTGGRPRLIDPKTGRDITAHGLRSTFRDWAAERTNYPNEVVEMALAHAVSNAVEAAYRRGDLFEKRVRLMREWANFINTLPVAAEVVPLRKGNTAA